MMLKRIVGTGAIAGALGLSAIGLATAASAAPAPQTIPGPAQHVQLDDWHGDGWHGGGHGWGEPGWRGPGWGGPGLYGPPPPPPPCAFGVCI
ncbi:hypothetical protein MNAB215_222 [Mycobacterium numidiamassiliense]|uniref:Uncharacterized protein n=2 Tax=Mycobacterium numidiamassiliense TaxID=1841861 RepID=A0A2U3P2U1_9MYCO|nr:hypothetical protein MNAB215_222 [Mycobacterium numidiamassiliense]